MRKPSRRILMGPLVAAALGIGCGSSSSAFAPDDPSQASRGIAAGPVGESELSSAALPKSSSTTPQACSRTVAIDRAGLDELLANWPSKPREAARELSGKYGTPLEASTESLVWHDAGQFKRITVTKSEVPHDFPKPHTDFIEHTIAFDVPIQKVADLLQFDTSLSINKTAGELSARGDREALNLRTLDLARAIVAGKKSVADARKALSSGGTE